MNVDRRLQDIMDRQEEIDTLTKELNSAYAALRRIIREGTRTAESDIVDFLILQGNYREKALSLYQSLEASLRGRSGELVMTVERKQDRRKYGKNLRERYCLAVLRGDTLLLVDRACARLYLPTEDVYAGVNTDNGEVKSREHKKTPLACPDLRLRDKIVPGLGPYSQSGAPAVVVVIGNDEVQRYVNVAGQGALSAYKEARAILYPQAPSNVYQISRHAQWNPR